ncbi:hypothetical protein F4814DRAFT_452302 [Daldinia grandis]|nr:hypothetical protein F4814DRAFT_452302 [Daldinia grandis]
MREDEIQSDLNRRPRKIDDSINGLMDFILSGATINGHNATFMEHPALYESLLDVEWARVQDNNNRILDILASRGIDISPPKDMANSQSVALVVQRRSPIAPTADIAARVIEALAALGKLDTAMTDQANEAKSFFTEIEKL